MHVHIAKTGPLRCCPYILDAADADEERRSITCWESNDPEKEKNKRLRASETHDKKTHVRSALNTRNTMISANAKRCPGVISQCLFGCAEVVEEFH